MMPCDGIISSRLIREHDRINKISKLGRVFWKRIVVFPVIKISIRKRPVLQDWHRLPPPSPSFIIGPNGQKDRDTATSGTGASSSTFGALRLWVLPAGPGLSIVSAVGGSGAAVPMEESGSWGGEGRATRAATEATAAWRCSCSSGGGKEVEKD